MRTRIWTSPSRPSRPWRVAVSVLLLTAGAGSPAAVAAGEGSLRFQGTRTGSADQIRVSVDDPATTSGSPAVDVGATPFTIEWWMRATKSDNFEEGVPCGANDNWLLGNVIVDRDRAGAGRKFGASVAGGTIVFGVRGASSSAGRSICGTTGVLDDRWHHVTVAFRPADGAMWIWVDGRLDASGTGPATDVSYPDDAVPQAVCGGPCTTDPYLAFGSSKRIDNPAYGGWLDEIRVSNVLRYARTFTPAKTPLNADQHTVALYHLDDGSGTRVANSATVAGSADAERLAGRNGEPEWSAQTPLAAGGQPVPSVAPSSGGTASDPASRGGLGVAGSGGATAGSGVPTARAGTSSPHQTILGSPESSPASRRAIRRSRSSLPLGPVVPPLFIALIGLGIAIAVASRFLREKRL